MTKDDVLFGYRQQLFAEAARTSVSADKDSQRNCFRQQVTTAADERYVDKVLSKHACGELFVEHLREAIEH